MSDVANTIYNEVPKQARRVIAKLEEHRKLAWDQRRDSSVEAQICAATAVIEATTSYEPSEADTKEIMAWCFEFWFN